MQLGYNPQLEKTEHTTQRRNVHHCLTYMLSGDVLNSAHFVSCMLHGVMGPLNLAHDLQCVICHSPLLMCGSILGVCI